MTNFTHKPDNACSYTYTGNVGAIQANIAGESVTYKHSVWGEENGTNV
jgi:hypothetical protein